MGREYWKSWSRSLGRRDEKENTTIGCMSGMLHYFDFQHMLFTGTSNVSSASVSRIHSSSHEHLKGLEAPRNSLELDDGKCLSNSAFEDDQFHDVPVAIQVSSSSSLSESKINTMMKALEDEKKAAGQVETPRTPSVVARLMGLQILPNQSSPSNKSSPEVKKCYSPEMMKTNKKTDKCVAPSYRQPLQVLNSNIPSLRRAQPDGGSYSLPETPRVSSERSRDAVPRLSLQINCNKENIDNCNGSLKLMDELSYNMPTSPPSYAASRSWKRGHGRFYDENRTARSQYFAREVVKQVKETVSNRRGINNASSFGDENSNKRIIRESRSCTPNLRILENSKITGNVGEVKPQSQSRSPPLSVPPSKQREFVSKGHVEEAKEVKKIVASKCKKANYERLTDKMKKQSSPAERFGKLENLSLPSLASIFESNPSTSQRSHLSSQMKACSSNASILTRGKDSSSSSSSSNLSRQRALLMNSRDGFPRTLEPQGTGMNQQYNKLSSSRKQDPRYKYIKSIFHHAGYTAASVPLFRWHSNSLPFDPIIFHQIELSLSCNADEGQQSLGPLRYRWNRKLLFHLVQEMLVDILPSQTYQPMSCRSINGEPILIQRLCDRVKGYPEMDCRVVGDIDSLIASDITEINIRQLTCHPLVKEQAKQVVCDVEREIIENLLIEIALSLNDST